MSRDFGSLDIEIAHIWIKFIRLSAAEEEPQLKNIALGVH